MTPPPRIAIADSIKGFTVLDDEPVEAVFEKIVRSLTVPLPIPVEVIVQILVERERGISFSDSDSGSAFAEDSRGLTGCVPEVVVGLGVCKKGIRWRWADGSPLGPKLGSDRLIYSVFLILAPDPRARLMTLRACWDLAHSTNLAKAISETQSLAEAESRALEVIRLSERLLELGGSPPFRPAEMPLSREAAIWMSKQMAKMDMRKVGYHVALPFLVPAGGLPPQFSDWEGKFIDLRFEMIEDPVLRQRVQTAFGAGVAVAFKKSEQWFSLRHTGSRLVVRPGELEALPISEDEAKDIVRLPEDWEIKVDITEKRESLA